MLQVPSVSSSLHASSFRAFASIRFMSGIPFSARGLHGLNVRGFKTCGMSPLSTSVASLSSLSLKTTSPLLSRGLASNSKEGNGGEDKGDAGVARWLFLCSGLVFSMVVIGGLTRLTRSGLSMTDWKLQGGKPPMNDEEWEAEFGKYKQSPEYRKVHNGISLEDFKFIYFWEYSHRMLGRVVGITFALPFAYFAYRGRLLRPGLKPRLFSILTLIGCQGLVGWWMVRSGLEEPEFETEEPKVSPYRLATHLLSAFGIYTLLFTTALKVHPSAMTGGVSVKIPPTLRGAAAVTTGLVALTVASGAFVAGNHAGLVYNEFPLMGGRLIPEDIIDPKLLPQWRNFFENSSLVQFDHRVLGMSTATSVFLLWTYATRILAPGSARLLAHSLLGMACLQASLGIGTLLYFVPVPLAAAHQAGSLTLFTLCLWFRHSLRRAPSRVMEGGVGGGGVGGVGGAAANRAFSTVSRPAPIPFTTRTPLRPYRMSPAPEDVRRVRS